MQEQTLFSYIEESLVHDQTWCTCWLRCVGGWVVGDTPQYLLEAKPMLQSLVGKLHTHTHEPLFASRVLSCLKPLCDKHFKAGGLKLMCSDTIS